MDKIDELLTRGVAKVMSEGRAARAAEERPQAAAQAGLRPSRPHMTIGNAVGLRKLRKFQELGHEVVLEIVGDWTARIGDPSGRDETRPRLTAEVVRENAKTYMEQFFRVVDRARTEVRWQSEWFGGFNLERALDLAGRFTLAQMLAHETFRKRYEAGAFLTILELMYPMLQGFNSVAINSDVEFGGTDQKFNNLAGRQLTDHGHAAAGHPAGAADPRHRRPQDGQVVRQYDRYHHAAAGYVRQGDVDERRCDAAVLRRGAGPTRRWRSPS